jgi:hypothetical protein
MEEVDFFECVSSMYVISSYFFSPGALYSRQYRHNANILIRIVEPPFDIFMHSRLRFSVGHGSGGCPSILSDT